MHDLSNTAGITTIQLAPSAAGLPDGLAEKIAGADVLILLSSSEQQDRQLNVETILASPTFEPGTIASHAYAHAVQLAHEQLLRQVRGEPTDAQRYQALREYALLAETDPERFEKISTMVLRLETAEMPEVPEVRTGTDHDKLADFLIHALLETAPLVQDEQPALA